MYMYLYCFIILLFHYVYVLLCYPSYYWNSGPVCLEINTINLCKSMNLTQVDMSPEYFNNGALKKTFWGRENP